MYYVHRIFSWWFTLLQFACYGICMLGLYAQWQAPEFSLWLFVPSMLAIPGAMLAQHGSHMASMCANRLKYR